MSRNKKHISEDEIRKGILIRVLVGILIAIFATIVIITIPKGNKEQNQISDTPTSHSRRTRTEDESEDSNSSRNVSNKQASKDIIAKDKNKVKIDIKSGTLTVDGAVIVITDTNVSHYSWTPLYKMQQKIEGEWQDMEIKNPENALLPETLIENVTGVMEQSLVWSNKYGQVGVGQYRIVKESEGIEFYAEFEVQ